MTKWLIPALTASCARKRSELLAMSEAAAAVAEKDRPGSEANPDLSGFGWGVYYASLTLQQSSLGAGRSELAREAQSAAARMLEILRDTPIAVDSLEDVRVYPKSIAALDWVGRWSEEVYALNAAMQQPGVDATAALQSLSRALNAIAWVATFPAPSLPFVDSSSMPQVPEPIRDLPIEDRMRIFQAFAGLHTDRLWFLSSLATIEPIPSPGQTNAIKPGRWVDVSQWAPYLEFLGKQLSTDKESLRSERSVLSLWALAVIAYDVGGSSPADSGALVS
jgi:hypothetical protein